MIDTKEQRQAILGATLAWLQAGAPHGENNIGFRMDYEVLVDGEVEVQDWNEDHCGTACCMIGHVSLTSWATYESLTEFMYASLDAPKDTTHHKNGTTLWTLFYPSMDDTFRPETGLKSLFQVTPPMAAAVLAHYIETGTTDWSLAKGL